jgi:hypothetical protein
LIKANSESNVVPWVRDIIKKLDQHQSRISTFVP